jgi:hypothetical protein
MRERKKFEDPTEDFESWKVFRWEQEETHQAEFALK